MDVCEALKLGNNLRNNYFYLLKRESNISLRLSEAHLVFYIATFHRSILKCSLIAHFYALKLSIKTNISIYISCNGKIKPERRNELLKLFNLLLLPLPSS